MVFDGVRMVASMASVDGIDGGNWGLRHSRALTWKSLCTEVACFHSEQFAGEKRFCPCVVLSSLSVCVSCLTVCQLPGVSFHSLLSLVMIMYIVTVILPAALCCL